MGKAVTVLVCVPQIGQQVWEDQYVQKIYKQFLWGNWELSTKGEMVWKHSWTGVITQEFFYLSEKKGTWEAAVSQNTSYPFRETDGMTSSSVCWVETV